MWNMTRGRVNFDTKWRPWIHRANRLTCSFGCHRYFDPDISWCLLSEDVDDDSKWSLRQNDLSPSPGGCLRCHPGFDNDEIQQMKQGYFHIRYDLINNFRLTCSECLARGDSI